MPVFDDFPAASPGVEVAVEPSMAVELEWVLGSALNRRWRDDHPTLDSVYAAVPGVEGAIEGLWGPEEALTCGGFTELFLLAHHAGVLFGTDGDGLAEAVEQAAGSLTPDQAHPSLGSENDEDRRIVHRRLALLRRSTARRRRYGEVLAALWPAVRQDWEAHGRRRVDQAVEARRRSLARGASWQEVAGGTSFPETASGFFDQLTRAVAALAPGSRLVVVPAYYTHLVLFTDLPGMLVVGVRTDPTAADARARTEALAKSLRTVSDPTRLAILDALRAGPRTVGELASSFALAQPTVSNHVKLLRDAGLVADERRGRRRELVVRGDAVEDLLAGLQHVLAG
ncbi:MAG: winged helix-turn-helix transcriptional regulator [Acidobacteriota bacterium]|nr:winged helix-turn-helix transcriptional regulator [Acidobacteriota bacterium]